MSEKSCKELMAGGELMYKWQESFYEFVSEKFGMSMREYDKLFIERIFNLLNSGTRYTDVNDKFIGYINILDGPLDIIRITSDHSSEHDNRRYVMIKVIYLNKDVLHLVIDDNVLLIYVFINGQWANSICKYGREKEQGELNEITL